MAYKFPSPMPHKFLHSSGDIGLGREMSKKGDFPAWEMTGVGKFKGRSVRVGKVLDSS